MKAALFVSHFSVFSQLFVLAARSLLYSPSFFNTQHITREAGWTAFNFHESRILFAFIIIQTKTDETA